MRKPAVFLDRDGTLIEERSYISRPEQVRLLPGTAQCLKTLREAGFACVVISNQSGIGRGLFTESDLARVHDEMNRQLKDGGATLDGIYWCSLAPRINDKTIVEHEDRKPGPGMLRRAAHELDLDLALSWMVGDSACDVLVGRNAGCKGSILLRTGHEVIGSLASLGDGDVVVDDLPAATAWILRNR